MQTNNTIVLTSIYQEFWGTQEFRKSCDRVGLPVYNAWQNPGRFTGHGETLRYDYEALVKLQEDYKFIIYADGADSLFLKSFTPPDNKIIYSAEKAVWPPDQRMNDFWKDYYSIYITPHKGRWSYLNGGGWCGPTSLLIEFFDRYGLNKYKGDIQGQREQAEALIKARKGGFPIELDSNCEYFQTTGFEDAGDFEITDGKFKNIVTDTEPCILHGNGRTDMKHLYETFNR